jgi:DNA-binding transcriptional ArsR family regulator
MPSSRLDTVFSALSDPTRRKIIEKLRVRDYTIGELAGLFDMSLPAVSKHLTILDNANLLKKEKEGKFTVCRFNPQPFRQAIKWIDAQYRFWNDGFDSLEEFLDKNNTPGKK